MQALTDKEKARLMHNKYQREWARRNKDKVEASRIKSLAKKYDEMMIGQIYDDFTAGHERGEVNE